MWKFSGAAAAILLVACGGGGGSGGVGATGAGLTAVTTQAWSGSDAGNNSGTPAAPPGAMQDANQQDAATAGQSTSPDTSPTTTSGWQPGMARPHPLDPATTQEDMARYDAWCATQAAGSCLRFDAQRPDVATASADDIALWNQHCPTARCTIDLPARSGRSLNWWGADPRLVEQTNASCSPQPDCRVPDGDLLVWNFACAPQPSCRIALSRPY